MFCPCTNKHAAIKVLDTGYIIAFFLLHNLVKVYFTFCLCFCFLNKCDESLIHMSASIYLHDNNMEM